MPSGLSKPQNLKPELVAIVGAGPMPRTKVISKLWEYIHKNGLQDSANKRMIKPDATFAKVFGSAPISMFDMNKKLGAFLEPA